MPIKTFTLQLEWAEMITPNVRHLAFRTVEGEAFTFVPGQFIRIQFTTTDGHELKRSYSIATISSESDLIEFAAGYVEGGPATHFLFGLQPGDTMTASGPFGRLILKDEQPKRLILVATSTGITPYRAMLPELVARIQTHNMEIHVLEGVQYKRDVMYANDFLAAAKQQANFHFHAHLSREKETDLDDYESCGYVQTSFDTLQLNPETDIIYLCGNPNMIDNAFEDLKARNFEIKNIRREKYISN